MKYALVFSIFGLTCAYYAYDSSLWWFRLFAASLGVAFLGVGLAYAFIGPRTFLKRADGRLAPFSYALYWPYHLLNWASLAGFRRAGKENAFDCIAENVYLGCRLSPRDIAETKRIGIQAVLDLTCEFSEIPHLRGLNYLCIPILDTKAPTIEQLKAGTSWIKEQAQSGPVYIHCALGHGRSATFVAAYLLLIGEVKSVNEAIEKIKDLRPRIGLHPEQITVLERWAQKLQSA